METNRVVVVTGAAGGIGALLIDSFLAIGDRVVATDLPGEALAALGDGRDLAPLSTIAADVSDEADCGSLAAHVRLVHGRADVLVNCAGWYPVRAFADMTADEWRRVIDVNLTGVFLVTRAVLPLMTGRGWGRIINFGSGTFFRGTANQAHYIAAKAGVIGLTRCLATELGEHGITVNVITPGLALTEPVRRTMSPEFLATVRNARPLKRDMLAADVVGATMFLASPGADFITGQTINVDGGATKY